MDIKNIFSLLQVNTTNEYFEDIISEADFRIERIISDGHTTPDDFWYNQDEDEFVLLLKGFAKLMFEDGSIIELNEGDYVIIDKHKKHKVIYTSTETKTFWITCYYKKKS